MAESIPYESTLTMQTYVQMRDQSGLDFLDVFTPSTNLERELGWDMEIRNLKGVVFQYKRPKLSANGNRRFSIRYSDHDPPRQLDQMKNYAVMYGDDIAYYALPLVVEHDDLEFTLDRMVFLNARVIPDAASVIHIPEDYCRNGRLQSTDSLEVYCSDPENTENSWDKYIDSDYSYGWKELYDGIAACSIGFQIRAHGESREETYHDEHQYYPKEDNLDRRPFSQAERFGLGQGTGRYITRFGSDDDAAFA